MYEPTDEDITYLNQHDQGVIGIDKPKVQHIKEPIDTHYYKRLQEARKLGVPEDTLNDEPDEMSDHSDDQGYDL